MDPIELYKHKIRMGLIRQGDPIFMLIKRMEMLERDNEKLQEIIDQRSVDRASEETVREPKPRRPYKKRVRKGEEIRRDSGTQKNSIPSES